MTKAEKKQMMMTCVSTLYKLNGIVPGIAELKAALGAGFEELIAEFFRNGSAAYQAESKTC